MRPQKYYEDEAEKFLELVWEDKIYKDDTIDKQRLLELLDLQSLQFIKMCKRNFGMHFKPFFKHCKVAEVKQILADLDKEEVLLKEIAEELEYKGSYGYSSMFHRDFKRIEGMTPMEFLFFHRHFKEVTGVGLAEYERPEKEIFINEDGEPTFLSNFLNKFANNL